MSRPRVLALLLVLTAASLLWAPAAGAGTLSPIADCQAHGGVLTVNYSTRELQRALSEMSVSVREYTTCYTAISDELNLRLGHAVKPIGDSASKTSSGSGGSGTAVLVVILAAVVLAGGSSAAWAAHRRRGR
ncbi:hypothetical protein [Conexibacter sp. DBS9H8]|uniref:hypothetical protein n=1 Tax=Conexibacter sp. DBS9H8 TaxID=2937801 RepID=UPI00200CF8E2|nr:hypothetical protein [Conexibacter sp. DBS9H8]